MGEYSERTLSFFDFTDEFDIYGYDRQHIKGFCYRRLENRSFRLERISRLSILDMSYNLI